MNISERCQLWYNEEAGISTLQYQRDINNRTFMFTCSSSPSVTSVIVSEVFLVGPSERIHNITFMKEGV